MSAFPGLESVKRVQELKLTASPTPSCELVESGINVCPPLTIKKQTLLPYCEETTTADSTALISSAVNLRLDDTFHLPA